MIVDINELRTYANCPLTYATRVLAINSVVPGIIVGPPSHRSLDPAVALYGEVANELIQNS